LPFCDSWCLMSGEMCELWRFQYVKIVSDKSVALVGIFLFHVVCVYFSLVLSLHFLSVIKTNSVALLRREFVSLPFLFMSLFCRSVFSFLVNQQICFYRTLQPTNSERIFHRGHVDVCSLSAKTRPFAGWELDRALWVGTRTLMSCTLIPAFKKGVRRFH
jgi:hypothetical protein